MFGIARRRSRSELVRQELGQGVEHFRQAATHAARGTGATVGPKISAARDRVQPATERVKGAAAFGWGSTVAVLAPLAAAATDGARQAGKDTRKAKSRNMRKLQKKTNKVLGRKHTGRNASRLTGLLIAGAAVGAAGAYVLKRRQRQHWDEYDPSRPVATADEVGGAAFEPTDSSSPRFGTASPSTVYGDTDPVGELSTPADHEAIDRTSSAVHNPDIARMTGGKNKI